MCYHSLGYVGKYSKVLNCFSLYGRPVKMSPMKLPVGVAECQKKGVADRGVVGFHEGGVADWSTEFVLVDVSPPSTVICLECSSKLVCLSFPLLMVGPVWKVPPFSVKLFVVFKTGLWNFAQVVAGSWLVSAVECVWPVFQHILVCA